MGAIVVRSIVLSPFSLIVYCSALKLIPGRLVCRRVYNMRWIAILSAFALAACSTVAENSETQESINQKIAKGKTTSRGESNIRRTQLHCQ